MTAPFWSSRRTTARCASRWDTVWKGRSPISPAKRIVSETILPQFKSQDFYGGITAGVGQIIRVIDGEPLPAPGNKPVGDTGNLQQYVPVLFILALAVSGVLRAALGKVPGSLVTGGVVAVMA